MTLPARPIDLKHILSSVSFLRPLPANVARTLRAMEDPSTTPAMVADMLALDQALTAYVLRMANSTHNGHTAPCASLNEAVDTLGFKQIQALLLSTVAAGPLTRRLNGYRQGNGELWEHSIAAANSARWLAQAIHYPSPEEAYVAGLLHDMGKLLLDQFVLIDYHRIIQSMWKRKLHLWQVERQLLGTDHAEVGGMMSVQWGFPPALSDAIRYHHTPVLARAQPSLAALVNLANAFTPPATLGLSFLGGRMIHPDSLKILNLEVPALERLRAAMLRSYAESEAGAISPPMYYELGA